MYDKIELKGKHDLFMREYCRVEPYINNRRGLTSDLNLREEYKKKLVETYNDLIDTIDPYLLTEPERTFIIPKFNGYLIKIKCAFKVLNLNYNFGTDSIFSSIDINLITPLNDSSDIDNPHTSESTSNEHLNSSVNISDTLSDKLNSTQQVLEDNSEENSEDNLEDNFEESSEHSSENDNPTMVQTKQDFIAIANRMINYKFDGDPLALDSFLDAIDLLDDLCEAANKPTMVKFIMTKLDGKARESILQTPATPADIVNQLKASIKPESSKVIEGRILALRADRTSLTKFAEQAEDLAEQFRRSLVVEGFSREKAKEIAIDKTIEMCRKSAKHSTVKSVLASASFKEPKEVIAKMIVEINNVKQDNPQSTYFHKNGNNQQRNSGGFQRNKGQNGNGFQHNRNQNANSNQNSNGRNNNRYNNGQNNGNRSGTNNGGRNGNNHNSGHQNWRNNTNGQHRSSGDQNVRVISGNETAPGNGGLQMHQ